MLFIKNMFIYLYQTKNNFNNGQTYKKKNELQ